MKTLLENWSLICSKLEQFKQNKNGIVALCPSHNDKNPSLAASYTDEKILVKCQAGCTFEEIVSALEMEQSQFFAPKEKTLSKKIVAIYRYEDKEGKLAFSVIRFKPKDFRPQRPDGKWTLEGVARVPYRLPQILAGKKDSKDILILEGEKDCDNAAKIGLTATTFPGGTGKWREEYSKWFQEAKVMCLPDNDDAGRKGMRLIASEIIKVAESVLWLELPDIPEKGDFSDWLKLEGNDFEKFKALASGTAVQWASDQVDQGHSPSGDFDEWSEPEVFNAKLFEELNQKYAIAPVGNKTLILEDSEEEIRFLTPSDFNLALENKFAFDNSGKYPKQIPAYKWWRNHPERREYNRVDFLPEIETPDGVFNMWKGFAVQPKGGLENIPLFHELLDEVICSGNERWAIYLWGWLANMVQFPEEKPGVAIVIRSDAQGVGKSRFVKYIGSLLGSHFRTVTHGSHIHGNFNSHLKDTLLLFGDEAVWGGERSTESILKQLITEPSMIIEMKGKDVFTVRSYLRLMLATNSEWAAPVGLTDRRYFVLDVSNSRKNDHGFFKQLINEQNNGGREALLQTLMDFDLSDFEVRSIPETPARLDQKFLSMDMIQKWWVDVLSDEDFTIGDKILHFEQDNRVAISVLSNSFDEYAKEHNPRHRLWSVQRFCGQFRKLVSNVELKRIGSGPREYQFPSLNECKLYFADKYSLDNDVFEIN